MNECVEHIAVDCSTEDVWQVLADFAHVADWVPFIVRSSVTTSGDIGVGSHRVIRHKWGFLLDEVVTEWDIGRTLSYSVSGAPYPLKELRESWRITPDDVGATVTTRVSYEVHLGPVGALIDWLIVRPFIRRAIRIGHQKLKHHIEAQPPPLGDHAEISK